MLQSDRQNCWPGRAYWAKGQRIFTIFVHKLHAFFFIGSFICACSANTNLHLHVSVADGSSNAGGRETIDFVSCQGRLFDTTNCSLSFAGRFIRTGNFKVCSWIEKTNFISFSHHLPDLAYRPHYSYQSPPPPA
jgi:hypothetical protein